MRAPNPCVKRSWCSTLLLRASLLAIASAIIGMGSAQAAPSDTPTSSTVAAPDVKAIARQLAVAAASTPADSCSADVNAASFSPAAPESSAITAALAEPPSSPLWVQCSLAYTTGKPGGDCTGKHTFHYYSNKAATVTAELMGLDANGNLLKSFVIQQDSVIQMGSRTSQSDWKFASGKNKDYTVFAPVPLIKVTAVGGGETAVAYCSNIPWTDVVQPSGGVVTEDGNGNSETKVLAAIPRTNPADLHLYLDGTDLLDPVVSPWLATPLTSCTPDNPCEGSSTLNGGGTVQVTGLIVDVAGTVDQLSSNTLSATLNNLSCGGHLVQVETSKAIGSLKNPTTESCDVDDLRDAASSSIFAIRITTPTPGLITGTVPTPVQGEICSGTEIMSANINGKVLNVIGQSKVSGQYGDLVTYTIDTTLGQTDLRDDFDGVTTALGTFDKGSNRLIATALEKQGTRAYKRFIFAVGSNIKPLGVDPSAVLINDPALQAMVNENLKTAVEAKLQAPLTNTATEIKNAFIVGLTAEGAQTIMSKVCNFPIDHDGDPNTPTLTPGQLFKQTVESVLSGLDEAHPITTFEYDPVCSCDIGDDEAPVAVFIDTVTVGSTLQCPITFEDHKIKVSLVLPDIYVKARAKGYCDDFWGHTDMDIWASVNIKGTHFDYELSEANILASSTAVANECDTAGACTTTFPDSFKVGAALDADAGGGVDFGWVGDACNFLISGFVYVLTFGQVDVLPLLAPEIDISEHIDFQQEIGPAKPNAIPLKGIGIEEQTVNPYHQKMSGLVSEVHITGPTTPPSLEGAGIALGLKGTFATTQVDLGVEPNPGIEVKEPPIPYMPSLRSQGAEDALVGLSEDAINMLFASLAGGGDMKVAGSDAQGCFATGATIGGLLPADCDTIDLGVGVELGTAAARGYCHAIKLDACDPLLYPDPDPTGLDYTGLLSGTERGVCHGAKGDVCSTVSPEGDLIEIGSCSVTPYFNLRHDQNLMFCVKGDIPTMGFPTVGGNGSKVPTELHLNDLSVSLVIDRGSNGVVDGGLNTLPGCFSGAQNTSDCNVFAACLDINLNFAMNNIICADSKPGFQAEFQSVKILNRAVGQVCSGTQTATSDGNVLTAASDDATITEPIALNAGVLSPPICGAGLDMAGFVTCANAKILALEAGVDPKFREFLAITCKLQ